MATTLPAPGDSVSDYQIVREVARGGMGVVFLAKQKNLNRTVAIKMILDSETSDEHLKRFTKEAEAAAGLDHPGIVPVYDVGQHNGFPYYSMPFVEGESLAHRLHQGPLEPKQAAQIAAEIADALSHAHQQQIIHRDIKPANVLIDESGKAKVTDFGVCKSLNQTSDLTSHGQLVGTPHYMPPEQAGDKENQVGPQSDVYSIGAVLYAMLTGRPPFQAANPVDVVSQVILQPPVSPAILNPSVPLELDVITLKCLSKSPRDRFATADQLAADLKRYLAGEPIKARPPSVIQRGRFFIRKHLLFASVSGSVALLLVILTAITCVALIRAQSHVTQLQASVDKLQAQLEAERLLGARIASQATRGRISETEFAIGRLTGQIELLKQDNPDVALQLAIFAADLASNGELPVPNELREYLASATEGDSASQSLDGLVSMAKTKIQTPLTEDQKKLYGLTTADQ